MVRFAYGLQNDISAVAAAVDNSWSTGQVEGQVSRLKMIKRQMHGRAGFELVRARVLPYSLAAGPAPSGRTKTAEGPISAEKNLGSMSRPTFSGAEGPA